MPLSCLEQEQFAVYVMDSSGSRHQIHGKYSAGDDGTLRLQSSTSQTSSRDLLTRVPVPDETDNSQIVVKMPTGECLSFGICPEQPISTLSVSYTHLRAHET